mmetsp:Transcript_11282/g.17456  ORF Transcript_11282/g.17456 Transcript_11282/m.17456 type:complete len:244 (+) Transcript_11282:239-970(+)
MSFTLLKSGGRWSHSRYSIPPLLGRAAVPEEIWLATFDEAVDRQNKFSAAAEQLAGTMGIKRGCVFLFTCISILFCVTIAPVDPMLLFYSAGCTILGCCCFRSLNSTELRNEIREEKAEHRLAWGRFVGEQQAVYRPYGVQVKSAKNQVTQTLIIGGLMFQLEQSSPPTQTRTFVQELESLYQLYQSGGLSRDEYFHAKTKLMRNAPQNSITSVAFAEAVSLDKSSTTASGHGMGENAAPKIV